MPYARRFPNLHAVEPPAGARLAGVEAGGTKFTCAVSDTDLHILASTTLPTRAPEETLADVLAFFRAHVDAPPVALGIASFGPLNYDRTSRAFGTIASTPKAGWQGVNLPHVLGSGLGVEQVVIDTDVNAAALGECRWGALRGFASGAYLTIGTGIGAGFVRDGQVFNGLVHPEFGHIRVPHDRERDPYRGACPIHGDCLEGLASGPAIMQRWSATPETLPADHPAWTLECSYVAAALANLICTVAPHRIVIGGGIASRLDWIELLLGVRRTLGDYLRVPELTHRLDTYIVRPGLGTTAGLIGALTLARSSIVAADIPRAVEAQA